MTFPNRAGYVPGQQRRARKSAATSPESSSPTATKTTPLNQKQTSCRTLQQSASGSKSFENLQQEIQTMLTSLSPANGPSRILGSAASQIPMSKEEFKAQVDRARKRLFEDELFQQNESYRRVVSFANNPMLQTSSGVIDPFDAAIELLPAPSQPSRSFGAHAGGNSNRSQYLEAVSRAVMDDPTVRARYEQAARSLQEYSERRVNQQRSSGSRAIGLPSTPPFSVSSISPFALELAARNSVPKKRSSLSKASKTLMREWFEENLHHPYPTEEEKEWLAAQGGITLEQVNNWFINTRGRKWKPMLNRLMAEKRAGDCTLYDKMVEKIEEPYHRDF